MVAAFLRAEFHSERFGERLRAAARRLAVPLEAVEHPDTADPNRNAQRLAILRDYRRYGQTNSLFDGFPYGDVSWSRCALSPDEVLAIRYIDDGYWRDLSGGTRLPTHAARRIRDGQADPEHTRNFLRIADALAAGAARRAHHRVGRR